MSFAPNEKNKKKKQERLQSNFRVEPLWSETFKGEPTKAMKKKRDIMALSNIMDNAL